MSTAGSEADPFKRVEFGIRQDRQVRLHTERARRVARQSNGLELGPLIGSDLFQDARQTIIASEQIISAWLWLGQFGFDESPKGLRQFAKLIERIKLGS